MIFLTLSTHRSVVSVDLDPDALAIAKDNVESVEMEDEIEFIHAEIGLPGTTPSTEGVPVFDKEMLEGEIDTVVTKCVSFSFSVLAQAWS
jgi:predicted O-methyltransferase YrrM